MKAVKLAGSGSMPEVRLRVSRKANRCFKEKPPGMEVELGVWKKIIEYFYFFKSIL